MATILVVEDDILLSLDTSDALKDAGYDVIAAANADEAIKVLETRNDIRTIFTDINMPGSMDGLKLAAAVRDRWPPVHIIVTSGMRAPHRDEMPAVKSSGDSERGTWLSSSCVAGSKSHFEVCMARTR